MSEAVAEDSETVRVREGSQVADPAAPAEPWAQALWQVQSRASGPRT